MGDGVVREQRENNQRIHCAVSLPASTSSPFTLSMPSLVRSKSRMNRLQKYGITDAQYQAKIPAGYGWCYFKAHFALVGEFSSMQGVCGACCPECQHHNLVRNRYGISGSAYELLLVQQNRACAICLQPPSGRRLAVDHNHVTGQVRGLLCVKCNAALERLDTHPNWAEQAIQYLATKSTT